MNPLITSIIKYKLKEVIAMCEVQVPILIELRLIV